MRYADSECSISEVYSPEHLYVVKGRDVFTGTEVTVNVPAAALSKYRRGMMIQDAMPMLSDQEREFLISGMWDEPDWGEE